MNWATAIKNVGGTIENTGGNCEAYRIPDGENCYWLITDCSGEPVLPDNGWAGLATRYYHDRPDGVETLVAAETLAAILALDWDSVVAAIDAAGGGEIDADYCATCGDSAPAVPMGKACPNCGDTKKACDY